MPNEELAKEVMERIPNFFDPYVLALIGVMLEIFGAIFLSFESLGKEWFSRGFNSIAKFSQWYKKSFKRMSLIIITILSILTLGIVFKLRILIGLFFPVLIVMGLFSVLIDNPEYYEKWIIKKASEGKIGPIGFIIIAFGGLIQMISILIHIGISK